MDWMTLFKAIDHVAKVRKQAWSEVEKKPYYEFHYILDAIRAEQKEREEQAEKEKKESGSNQSGKQFKPLDTNAMLRNQQANMKNYKPKI